MWAQLSALPNCVIVGAGKLGYVEATPFIEIKYGLALLKNQQQITL